MGNLCSAAKAVEEEEVMLTRRVSREVASQ